MKSICALAVCMSLASAFAAEKGTGLYKFEGNQTNVYRVEVEAQSDMGPEAAAGIFTLSTGSNVVDAVKVSIRGQFGPRPGRGSIYRPGNVPLLAMLGSGPMMQPSQGRELIVDGAGTVVRSGFEPPLPIPFGTLFTALFPAGAESAEVTNDVVYVMDEPLMVGPAEYFSFSPYGGFAYAYNPSQRQAGVLKARRTQKVSVQRTNDGTEVRSTITIDSFLNTGDEPRISSSAQATWLIDSGVGWPKTARWEAKTLLVSEAMTRRFTLKLTAKRLEGEELKEALNPPPAPPVEPAKEQPISAATASELIEKLSSEDQGARMTAANELYAKRVEPLPDTALDALIALTTHSDEFIRRAALKVLAAQGRASDLEPLLRGYNDTDDSQMRQQIIKAIGRMKTEKAATALAELIAAGTVESYAGRTSELSEALSRMGPMAEAAVAPLLEERNLRTLVDACSVLKTVGTEKSMPALKEMATHPNKTVSEAAAAALREIRARL